MSDAAVSEAIREHVGKPVTEAHLLGVAGWCLATIARARAGGDSLVHEAGVELQRAAIAAVARGLVRVGQAEQIPDDAFTWSPRLFAWWCSLRAARVLARRVSFFAVRYALAAAPRIALREDEKPITKADVARYREEHGVEATEEWLLRLHDSPEEGSSAWLQQGAQIEIDAAEELQGVTAGALAALLQDARRRRAQAWLEPVMAAMQAGRPMADTASRLREAAQIFEGAR